MRPDFKNISPQINNSPELPEENTRKFSQTSEGIRLKSIFTKEELTGVSKLQVTDLKTSAFINTGKGKFKELSLPQEVQFSPVFTITAFDYDKDGNKDLLLCGNISHSRLRFGKYDANYGTLLKGNGKGGFTYIPQQQSGFNIKGDVRSVVQTNNSLIFGISQESMKAYKLR